MTIGHGNWNGIRMAAILAFLGAPAMLQGYYGGAITITPQSTLLYYCSWALSRAKIYI